MEGRAKQQNLLGLILKCLLYHDCLPLTYGWSRITLSSTQRNREKREQEYPCEGSDFYWKWGRCALKWKGYGGQDKLPCWKQGIAFEISFPKHPFLLAEKLYNWETLHMSHSWSAWSMQVWTAFSSSHNAGTEDWGWSFCLSPVPVSWMTCLTHLVPVHPEFARIDIYTIQRMMEHQKASS